MTAALMQADDLGVPAALAVAPARWWRTVEELGVLAALLALTTLPLAEIVLRRVAGAGISNSSALVQHLTLVVSMLGAALAARDGRLIALATTTFFRGTRKHLATLVSSAIAAAVTLFLAIGSWQFVLSQRNGRALAYGIPLWMVQMVLPLGFAAVALRLLWRAGNDWRVRSVAATVAVTIAAAVFLLRGATHATVPSFVLLLLAAVTGAPIFVVIGGAALILFWQSGVPIAAVAVGHYSLVVNPSLPAIPLFTLAGYLLAEGGASTRLVRVFQHLFGSIRGGPAIVTALACAFFTSFTGGSGVTILALGGLLLPVLLQAGYSNRSALGLITGAGSLGLLFPPCLPLILYAIVANVPMEQMFLGGLLPGTLLVVMTAWWGTRQETHNGSRPPFARVAAARAVWEAKWELLLPVVVIVVLFAGFATPVEAAAFAALYAFVVETFVYGDLRPLSKLAHVFAEAGLLIGGVLLVLGVALGLTSYLIDAEIPAHAVAWATASIHSPLVFLLMLNVFLLFVGCLVEIFPAIVVVVPLIVPLGAAFHIDPVHLGIIFLSNLELGYLMPPVGMNLLIASYRFDKPIGEVWRASLPMMLVLLVGVLLITYIPPLTTFLPRLLVH